jgi:multidrug efflux pump subunit AcrA (membrane-fusion protein)
MSIGKVLLALALFAGVGAALVWAVSSSQRQRAAIAAGARLRDERANLEPWQREGQFVVAQGTIDVAEGTTRLATSLPGRVASVLVQDGESVKQGQPLLELDVREAKTSLERAEAGVREAEISLREANNQIAIHALRIRQQQQKLAAARAALEVEQTQLQKIDSVGDRAGAAESTRSMQQKQVVAQQAIVEVETLQLEQLEKIRPQDAVDQASAALAVAQAERSQAEAVLDNHTLKSPSDGTVLQVRARPGEIVGPGTNDLIWFVGAGPRIIRCEVNHRFSRVVGEGMPVLYYQDDNGTLLGRGRVERRSVWIADQREQSSRPFQRVDQRTLECLVAIETHPDRLWIGERVRVVIRTDGLGESAVSESESPTPVSQAER